MNATALSPVNIRSARQRLALDEHDSTRRRRAWCHVVASLCFSIAACHDPLASPRELTQGVVLILVDALRADRVTCLGYPPATTPNMDELAARGVLFTRAYSPSTRTTPAIASLFTGVHVARHGVLALGYDFILPEQFTTIAENFASAGYATSAVSASVAFSTRSGMGQGFSVFHELAPGDGATSSEWRGQRVSRAYRHGNEVVPIVVNELRRLSSRRFFLVVHLFEPHLPDQHDERFANRFPHAYDEDVALADNYIGKVIQAIAELGLTDKVLIAVTADHGENLNDEDPKYRGHANVLRNTVHIPWIIAGPGVKPKRVAVPVTTLDLFESFARLIRARPVSYPLDSVSLHSTIWGNDAPAPRPIFMRESYEYGSTGMLAVAVGPWRYVRPFEMEAMRPMRPHLAPEHSLTRRSGLFNDEPSTQDVRVNHALAESETTARLDEVLASWRKRSSPVFPERPAAPLTQIDELRALGYLE